MTDLREARFGYVPYDPSFRPPGDRRRFCFWAQERNIDFEIADPARRYDVIYLTTRSDISFWSRYEGPGKLVFELIDSYLALDPRKPKNMLRGPAKFISRELSRPTLSYPHVLEKMCERADAVVCSTEEQQRDISIHNSNVHVILDSHEEVGNNFKTDHGLGDRLNLVWEGLPENLTNFRVMGGALQDLSRNLPMVLHLVTDTSFKRYLGRFGSRRTNDVAARLHDDVRVYPWSPQTLEKTVIGADIGIIPLKLDDPFAAGKPENKLLIFWRLGIPTLTSATPSYVRVMDQAGVDMYCRTAEEWGEKLKRYSSDEASRREAALAGRAYVQERHTREGLLKRWDDLFESVLG
jgi:glycosyltransferase involved in cell wall biosynthesis